MADEEETAEDEEDYGGTGRLMDVFSVLNQFLTCCGVLLLPFVAGIEIIRERQNKLLYYQSFSKSTVDFLPVAGDLLGSLLCGLIMHYLGRKINLVLTNVLYVAALLMPVTEAGPSAQFAGVVVGHFAHRFLIVTATVYVSEVTAPRPRGPFVGLIFVGLTAGSLAAHLARDTPRLPVLAGFLLAVCSLVQSFLVPQSPYWLALDGRRDAAEQTLDAVRAGRGDPAEAAAMFDRAEEDAELRRQRGLVRILWRRNFFVPLLVLFFMLLANNDMCYVISAHIEEIEERAWFWKRHYDAMQADRGSPAKAQKYEPRPLAATLTPPAYAEQLLEFGFPLLASLGFVAPLSLVLGRRPLFVTSILLSVAVFPAVIVRLNDPRPTEMTATDHTAICLWCGLFTHLGAKQITRILPPEIFPSVVRDLGVAFCDFMETTIGVLEVFSSYNGKWKWYFLLWNKARWTLTPLGIVFTLIFMPETKDKPLTETEILGGKLDAGFLAPIGEEENV